MGGKRTLTGRSSALSFRYESLPCGRSESAVSKPTVVISIDTYADTTAEAFGRSFIESLCDEDPRLVPEKLSTTESCKDSFLGIDDFLANWWAIPVKTTVDGQSRPDRFDGPFWKRKSSLASRGMVNHGITDLWNHRHTSGLWFECRWAEDVDFNHLFDAWVQLSHPDIAMLHVFTDSELHLEDQKSDRSFKLGVLSGGPQQGLPNIGWAMAYGAEFLPEVDVNRIKAAGFPVDQHDKFVVVRVTEKLSDVLHDFAHFSRRRAELKALFRPDLYWIKDEPRERSTIA